MGDQIEGVLNAPRLNLGAQPPAADSVFDKLSSLNAGQVAQLRVLRGGATVTVAVKLDSLADSSATSLIIPANTYNEYAL